MSSSLKDVMKKVARASSAVKSSVQTDIHTQDQRKAAFMHLAPIIDSLNKFELSKLTSQLIEAESPLSILLKEKREFLKSVACYRAIEEILDNPESTIENKQESSDPSDLTDTLNGYVKNLEKYRDQLSAHDTDTIPSVEELAKQSGLSIQIAQMFLSAVIDAEGVPRKPCQKFTEVDEKTLMSKYPEPENPDLESALTNPEVMMPLMVEMMICADCKCFKTVHQACNRIQYQGDKYSNCITCGLGSDQHQTCSNFQYSSSTPAKSYDEPVCEVCNKSRHDHQNLLTKQGKQTCYNYEADGHECCNICRFNLRDHTFSKKYRALTPANQSRVSNLMLGITTSSFVGGLDFKMINVLASPLVYVENYMELQKIQFGK
jgi:hypothetical protein